MKQKIAWLLVIVMMLAMVGCAPTTGSSEPKQESSASAPAAPAAPAESGKAEAEPAEVRDTVNLSVTSALLSVDPHPRRDLQDMLTHGQVYEPLFYLNEKTLEFEPRIAESYSVSDDGLTYTFNLRKGVKFHNGDELKASDVVFSLLRVKESAAWSAYSSNIADVIAVDDYTVDIKVNTVDATFMVCQAQLMIISEREATEQGEAFGTQVALAGTGPYFFTAVDADVAWSLEAFPDYYRGEAPIKYINFRPISDASAGLIAFEAGELDYYNAPVANWAELSSNEAYKTEVVAGNHISYMAINHLSSEALGNDLVRQAIAYCIDKESMNLAAFDGLAEEADYMENPAYNVGSPRSEIVYNYDLEKAKTLMEEAGYADGFDLGTIMVIPGGYYEKMAQVLQANLLAIGITAEIEPLQSNTITERGTKQDFDMMVYGYPSIGDYSNIAFKTHSQYVGSYFVKFEGDKFDYKRIDSLLDEGKACLDAEKRLEINAQANDAIMETATLLPGLHKALPYVWNADLNVVNMPNTYHVYDWSWNS